jgi:hypothetical protein
VLVQEAAQETDHDQQVLAAEAGSRRSVAAHGYAIAAASRGTRRETTCETPSVPIVTP